MRAIRSLLTFLWIALSVIPMGTLLLVFSLFVSAERVWWWFAQPWLAGAIFAVRWIGGVKYRVHGLEHLPPKGDNQRIILCPKHQSTWETFFFPSMAPHSLAYVFKRELLYVPFFGWSMARLDMVHIDRSARSEAWAKVASLGAKLMDKGKWVIMFPEGTRTPRGSQGDYKSGAARLALATGARIIPIAVASGRCWPRRSWRFIPGTIDVSIGPPMEIADGESPAELMSRVEDWIETEMRVIDPEAYIGEAGRL
ncbi:MAG: lysophospholipid acyltransferase family protein [Cellvibrionales bacterium]